MSRATKRDRTNTVPLLLLIVGFAILFYYGITSLFARDPLCEILKYNKGYNREVHKSQV